MIQSFSLCQGKYISGAILGRGAFSVVLEGRVQETGARVAIKLLNAEWEAKAKKSPQHRQQLEAEIEILRESSTPGHPNIVLLLDTGFHPDTGQLGLVMEYCSEGDFESYLVNKGGKISEEESIVFFKQLAAGLGYLRNKGIMHRDLKTENLLLNRKDSYIELKIADFGLAKVLDDGAGMANTQCGTRYYMAPEIYLGLPYSHKADLWSVGVIIYRTLTGKMLFSQVPSLQILCDPNHSFFKPKENMALSDDCRDLLSGLLQKDSLQRITFEEFSSHKFLNTSEYGMFEFEGYTSDGTTQRRATSRTLPRKVTNPNRRSQDRGGTRSADQKEEFSAGETPNSLQKKILPHLEIPLLHRPSAGHEGGVGGAFLSPAPFTGNDSSSNLASGFPPSPSHADLLAIVVLVYDLAQQMENLEETFIIQFRVVQVLQAMLASQEYIGSERLQLTKLIREIQDMMDSSLPNLDTKRTVTTFSSIMLGLISRLAFSAAKLEKEEKFSEATNFYKQGEMSLQFLLLWCNYHSQKLNDLLIYFQRLFEGRRRIVAQRSLKA